MHTEITSRKTRRGLPIAALLFGLIGLLELGWVWMENLKPNPCGRPLTEDYFSIPSLLGFMLGLIAIRKNTHGALISLAEGFQATIWPGGKLLAILGVVGSAPGLILAIASLPSCSIYAIHTCRAIGPLHTLRIIHNSQAQYYATLSRFATLEELNAARYIDAAEANGSPVHGYVYSSSDVTAETYCAHADRANDICGNRDFIVCEDGIIRYTESKVRGTVKRDEGTPIGVGGSRRGEGPSGGTVKRDEGTPIGEPRSAGSDGQIQK